MSASVEAVVDDGLGGLCRGDAGERSLGDAPADAIRGRSLSKRLLGLLHFRAQLLLGDYALQLELHDAFDDLLAVLDGRFATATWCERDEQRPEQPGREPGPARYEGHDAPVLTTQLKSARVLLTSLHLTTHGFPRQFGAFPRRCMFLDGAVSRGQEACT